VNLLFYLTDQLPRGFQYVDDQFRLCRLKQLKVFRLWYPASRAKIDVAQIQINERISVRFSGSAGFGALKIFVPPFNNCVTNF
jgi:hypothetical protein